MLKGYFKRRKKLIEANRQLALELKRTRNEVKYWARQYVNLEHTNEMLHARLAEAEKKPLEVIIIDRRKEEQKNGQ